jgi:hypothetical protein
MSVVSEPEALASFVITFRAHIESVNFITSSE